MAKNKNKQFVRKVENEKISFPEFVLIFLWFYIPVLYFTKVQILPLKINIIFVSVISFLTPGYFACRLLLKENIPDFFEIYSLSFLSFFIFYLVPGLSGYLLGLSITAIVYLYFILSLLLISGGILFIKKRNIQQKGRPQDRIPGEDNTSALTGHRKIILFLIPVILFLIAYDFGCWISGDYVYHGLHLRKLLELPGIIRTNFFIRDLKGLLYGYNIWHLFLAMLSKITGADPSIVWALSGSWLVVLKIAAFYTSSKFIFRDKNISFISTLIYFIWEGLLAYNPVEGYSMLTSKMHFNSWYFAISAYPANVSKEIIYYLVLGFFFKYFYTGNKKYAFLFLVFGLLIDTTHFFYFFLAVYIFAGICIFAFFDYKKDKETFNRALLVTVLFIVSGIFLAFYFIKIQDKPVVNPYYADLRKSDPFFPVHYIKNKWPVVLPFKGFVQNEVRFLAVLFLPFIFIYRKKEIWMKYILSSFIFTMILFFFPPVLFLMDKLTHNLQRVCRFTEVLPYNMALGAAISTGLGNQNKKIRSVTGIFVVISLIYVFYKIYNVLDSYKNMQFRVDSVISSSENQKSFKEMVDKTIPPGSVVLGDINLYWGWLTLFPHYCVSYPNPSGLPPNFDPTLRNEGIKKFFSNDNLFDGIKFLNETGTEYIVLDRRVNPENILIKTNPDKFILKFKTGSLEIYQYKI